MTKKNITIIGLIDNIGGREIEARSIINALSKYYNVRVVSLFFMTKDSEAIKGLQCNWTNIYKELNNANILLKLISLLLKTVRRRKQPSYFLVDNKLSRKFFNLPKLKNKLLKNEIKNTDAILYCGTLHLHALNEMIRCCNQLNKPIVLRTTGKIKSINNTFKTIIPIVDVTLVHSMQNSTLLKEYHPKNITVIDQTSLQEDNLLALPIEKKDHLTYGYLGRFSKEKGIIELLKVFNTLEKKLIIAGSGPLRNEMNPLLSKNITLLNTISPERISDYFKKIDVLIIPSYEEAGPLVGIEALAAGKIILSTKVGAMEDRLENTENSFWFNINEEHTLINLIKLLSLMSPDQIKEIRNKNRMHYIKNYSVSKISKNYVEVFNKLLS